MKTILLKLLSAGFAANSTKLLSVSFTNNSTKLLSAGFAANSTKLLSAGFAANSTKLLSAGFAANSTKLLSAGFTAISTKLLLVRSTILATSLLFANPTAFATNLEDLEARVNALEKAVADKLGDCQMTYKHHAYRLNRCDEGTFARSVINVGNNTYQHECGYYQLACKRTPSSD